MARTQNTLPPMEPQHTARPTLGGVKEKIAVGMSGGVDSSTTAALLIEQGYEVVGLAMKTHSLAEHSNRACCTPDDMRDARRVADRLGIAFYVLNYEELFLREVVRPFAEAYLAGTTPNPCVRCNDRVKFGPLLARAELLGATALATGHYARLVDGPSGPVLRRAHDSDKDQSYFLHRLTPAQLRKLRFPLGEMTKTEVRAHARRLGLEIADKRESQEICFVGAKGYAHTVEQIAKTNDNGADSTTQRDAQPTRDGAILGPNNEKLGSHGGVHNFTLGQRRGLRIVGSEPLYVTGLDAKTREVRVGPRTALLHKQVVLHELSFAYGTPKLGARLHLQMRHRGRAEPVTVLEQSETKLVLGFDEPTLVGAPGQAGVIYDDELVLGGGILGATPQVAAQAPESVDAETSSQASRCATAPEA